MEIIIIAAVAENGVIGRDGDIPWHIPEDLKHFKQKTSGHAVLMGRKTYFSLPEDYRPLSDRKNIVLSRSEPDVPEEVEVASSLEQGFEKASEHEKCFVIGGAGVYEQSLDYADRLVLTEVEKNPEGDTYFPDWDEEEWKEVEREERDGFSFVEYEKIT